MVAELPATRRADQAVASPEVLEAWCDEHAPCLFALAHRMLGDKAAAEAVVVEVFVVAHQTGGHWPPRTCGQRLLQLTHQRASAICRQRRSDGAPRPGRATPHWPLSELSDSHRDLLEAAYFEGFTMDELAAYLDLPRAVAMGRLREAVDQVARVVAAKDGAIP